MPGFKVGFTSCMVPILSPMIVDNLPNPGAAQTYKFPTWRSLLYVKSHGYACPPPPPGGTIDRRIRFT